MAIQLSGSLALTGSLTTTGTITAQTLNVQQVTSSIVYSSGSNIFGNSVSNIQQFTGSLQVSGSSHYLLGNVGIGTSSTSAKVHIKQSSSNWYDGIRVFDGSSNAWIGIGNTGGVAVLASSYDNAGSYLPLAFYTNDVEKMRITSGGNVGIGTTSPNNPLTVVGDIESRYTTGTSTVNYLRLGTYVGGLYGSYIGASSNYSGTLNTDLRFGVSNGGVLEEAMSITSAGNVGIGTTSPNGKLTVIGVDNSNIITILANGNSRLNIGTTATAQVYIRSQNSVSLRLGIDTQDHLTIVSGGAATFSSLGTGTVYSSSGTLTNTSPSDANLKSNIKPIEYGLNEILQLNPVTYNWKHDPINQGKQYGFIAQEIQPIMPDLVKEGEYLGLDKEAIFTIMVKAIQEQQTQINALKAKLGE